MLAKYFVLLILNQLFLPSSPSKTLHNSLFLPVSNNIFNSFTKTWQSSHQNWVRINEIDALSYCNIDRTYSGNVTITYPVCVAGKILFFNSHNGSNLDMCPSAMCYDYESKCSYTPSDTVEYLPPPVAGSLDSLTICSPGDDFIDPLISDNMHDLDSGTPPNFRPFTAVRLNISGTISAKFNGMCVPVANARILAWQIDPRKLKPFNSYPDDIVDSVTNISSKSLRDISCSAIQHTDENGHFKFQTLMPPTYGPPRHIAFLISAPGFQTLVTRMYFDKDWRLQQLTTLGGDPFVSPFSPSNTFPGAIAKDPRVVSVTFVPNKVDEGDHESFNSGVFVSSFDIVLRPLRPSEDVSSIPPIDLNGYWSDQLGGLIKVHSVGDSFIATEHPHPRRWGTVQGSVYGNTIRGVDFHHMPPTSSKEESLSEYSPFTWTSTPSTGLVVQRDPFSTLQFTPSQMLSLSIRWTGNYENIWSKETNPKSLQSVGYRYVKLYITRETGGFVGGKMVINEIRFYEGIFDQIERPTMDLKMKSPRTPNPQMVTCSSFQDQHTHCFKAFDGDDSSGSYWVTKAIGSFDSYLTIPQSVTFDFGPGKGVHLTGMKIACDAENVEAPKGCPKTFVLMGSYDNSKYDVLYKIDMDKCNNDYAVPGGKMFYFTFEAGKGRENGQRCGSCDTGPKFSCNKDAFDSLCASRFCTIDGLCGNVPACPAGEYLAPSFHDSNDPAFECIKCPPGSFGNESGLFDSRCSGLCSAGYYCVAGSTSSTQFSCGSNAFYCPEGSALPIEAPSGRKTIGGDADGMSRTAAVLCSPGFYCQNGMEIPCPTGYFGNFSGLATAECSGKCLPGSYCPSPSAVPISCSLGHYCPDGLVQIPCSAGKFGATIGLKDSSCSGFCSLGHYCPSGSSSATQMPCPAGRFGALNGLGNSNCSGLCHEGYYCPAGTIGSTKKCGDSNHYCPAGSSKPWEVSLGYYSVGGKDETTRSDQALCNIGYYCKKGLKVPCPVGSYGSTEGLYADFVNLTASFLAESSTRSPTQVPRSRSPTRKPTQKPTITPTFRPSIEPSIEPTISPSFDPAGSSPLNIFPTAEPFVTATLGDFSPTLDPTTADMFLDTQFFCSGQCPAGYYCPKNSTAPIPCPAGKFGAVPGLAIPSCSGDCPLGSYCPLGTITPIRCPPGRFGSSMGLIDSTCSSDCWQGGCNPEVSACMQGYFCPLGSIAANQYSCGGADRYCPTGSASPVPVSDGFYTVSADFENSIYTRVNQQLCERGFYCSGGIRYPCPAGTFGSFPGLTEPACSGQCPLGYFCPEGTINATMYSCPAGRYGGRLGLTDSACSGLCDAGYYCPAGSISATQRDCGVVVTSMLTAEEVINMKVTPTEQLSASLLTPTGYMSYIENTADGNYSAEFHASSYGSNETVLVNVLYLQEPNSVFCPQGSALPMRALQGYYTAGATMTTRTMQLPCNAGFYCVQGVSRRCPAGRYGGVDRLLDANCTGPCAKGHYCLQGSTSSLQNPCPAGKYGAVEGLKTPHCSGSCLTPLSCPKGTVVEIASQTAS